MVENVVKNKSTMERLNVTTCCFFFTLRAGTLIVGLSMAITGLLWVIGAFVGGGTAYAGLLSGILLLIAGALVIFAFKKENSTFLWYAVYLLLVITLWLIIGAIIFLATIKIGAGIVSILNALVILYCAAVIRSYAFELAEGPTTAPANPA